MPVQVVSPFGADAVDADPAGLSVMAGADDPLGIVLNYGSSPADIRTAYDRRLAEDYGRRFGARRPSAKEVSELFTDSFTGFALEARGLHFGATTLDQLTRWGAELRLLDQSRYVPERQGGNLIWLTSDVGTGPDGQIVHARRRRYVDHAAAVGGALIDVYFEERARATDVAASEQARSTSPYQPIHIVRAGAAVRTGTARVLGDRALEDLAAGRLELGVRVRLLPARLELPPRSERSTRIRAVHLTMTRQNGDKEERR